MLGNMVVLIGSHQKFMFGAETTHIADDAESFYETKQSFLKCLHSAVDTSLDRRTTLSTEYNVRPRRVLLNF